MRTKLFGIMVGCVFASGLPASAEPNRGGYDCASMVSEVIAATKANRDTVKAELIAIENVSRVLERPDRLECTGLGLWSNASRGPIRFFAVEEFDRWWIEYSAG